MAEQFTLQATKTSSLQRKRSSTSASWTDNWKQAKGEEHMVQGFETNHLEQFRHLLQFAMPDWSNVATITKAELHVFTAGDHSGMKTEVPPKGTKSNLKVAVKTKSWTESGGGERLWTGGLPDDGANYNDSYRAYALVSATALAHTVINVGPLVRYWAAKSVKTAWGTGLAKPNYGLVTQVAGTSPDTYKHETVLASPKHVNTGIRPYLVITYEPKGGPGGVILDQPDGTIAAGVPQFLTGSWERGRPGDTMVAVTIQVQETGKAAITWVHNADPNEVATSSFSVPIDLALVKSATTYAWTAKVKTSKGDETPYVPTQTLRLASPPPSLQALVPTGSQTTLDSVPFTARYTASAGQYRASAWQVQMRTQLADTDPMWDEDLLWDTGPMTVAAGAEAATPVTTPWTVDLTTLYGGPGLPPGAYSCRMQAFDPFGSATGWKYIQFSLTQAYYPEGDDLRVNMTRYGKPPPHRIRIYAVDLTAGKGRGPGKLVAELTDAANVGASEYYNSAGEFYFTLPATHPQVGVIEPYQVHYELQLHTGQGWRGIAYGLITDFDATEDEVVFYGQDYMALLGRTVEERFSTVDAELPTDKGGAKYVDQTIKDIVVDQLTKEKAKANSPIGFININAADIAAMPEKATIYTSFKQRLPFISGLIDSSRAGTGRRTRLMPSRNSDGVWKWRVIYAPGIDRPNIRLEYGGLVQGFRTIPFSDWGTAVDAIGRTVTGTKVYSARAVAPGISEGTYGAFPTTTMYQDIDDANDLQRRANQAAAKVGKVGKMLGVGIRVGSLTVKDGWDICDSVPVNIKRGVVDTSRFGPDANGHSWWTIWGWTWNSFSDGHSNMVLSLAPREDNLPPNADLIPSAPILDIPEWQLDDAPPTTIDDGKYWLDTSTGDVYEKQEDGTWLVTGSMLGPAGDPGNLIGNYIWKAAGTLRSATPPALGEITLTTPPVAGGANTMSVSATDAEGIDRTDRLALAVPGDAFIVTVAGLTDSYRVETTGAGTVVGSYWTFPIIWPVSSQPPNAEPVIQTLAVAGPDGATGPAGAPGPAGPAGPTGPAGSADTSPPPVPVIKGTPTSTLTQQEDGSPAVAITVVVGYASPPAGLTDLAEYILQSTRFGAGGVPDWTLATQWVVRAASSLGVADPTGALDVTIVQPSALAATPYWLRVAAGDTSNNRSGYSAYVQISTVGDVSGPPQPAGIVVGPGYQVFGVRWSPIAADDLAYVEVQWKLHADSTWVNSVEVPGTAIVVVGLTNGVMYDVRLRSVDRSGNTVDADTLTYKVADAANAEKGWVSGGSVTPTNIPGSSLYWDQAQINSIFAGKVNADWIYTGTLKVGGGANMAAAITVVDSAGQTIGLWDANGITLLDPPRAGYAGNPNYKMTMDEQGLLVWDMSDAANPVKVVAITPLGIDAASITFGSARGGHNMVPNSSFELGAFGQTVVTPNTWDVAADWNATRNGADTNITTGASTLTMATV